VADQPKKHYLAEAEEQMLKLWDREHTFEQSLENRKGAPRFSFYDGPPYANGLPHHGHAVQSILKDSVTRYKTMRGYYVPRRIGWDTHGLPIEYKVEQELGFNNKADIIKYGIDKFNQACRESVFTYVKEWNQFYRRLGRWADYDNSYATLDSSYIESVWWSFAQIYKHGLVYEDFRSTPYCPRCATPLSNFEVNQGYRDGVRDPSLFVKFQLKDDNRNLLAWTTTPWSLPGNAAIAVNPGEQYVTIKMKNDDGKDERLVLAEQRLSILDGDYEVEGQMSGQELVGLPYKPLFNLDAKTYAGVTSPNIYKVWGADFVSIEDGSGVLHVAPAFGEDDLALAKERDIPVLSTIDQNGHIRDGIGFDETKGLLFKDADKPIIEHLTKQRSVFAVETIEHTYPFCWRCDSPLLYYATTAWFIRVSDIRDRLVANNEQINWIPRHIKNGRFGKWLEGARDWTFSRSRFWGAPLPIWKTKDGEVIVVESISELQSLSKEPFDTKDLHRPYIDNVVLKTKDGKEAYRVEEVFDVWFESGSMPYGQDHYPFEHKKEMEENFPADFIAEAMDQTRGWFYSLHVIASILFDKPAFKNCITTGWVNAADGQKLSKRLKNYTPLDVIFDSYGVDTIRYFMMTSPIVHGEDIRFSSDSLNEVQRNVFMTLQNTFNFFKMYRDIDGWMPNKELVVPVVKSLLDRWVLARVEQTTGKVTKHADRYEVDQATKPIKELLDDVSNWYVRRSRRRFWKSQDDIDKHTAYATLHYVLIRLTQLLAPWAPFMSDRLYRELVADMHMPQSVHLTDWPNSQSFDTVVLTQMTEVRQLVADGLALRAEAKIKVRQPLARATIFTDKKDSLSAEYLQIIADELNVKAVDIGKSSAQATTTPKISLDTAVSQALQLEGLMRDVIRLIQNARKKAGLEVNDRIVLAIQTDKADIIKAIDAHKTTIMAETLSVDLTFEPVSHGFSETVKIDGNSLTISLKKSNR